ncbi:MAG: Gfo/Idh/MocA family oxidoreductase [Chloroflexi bacterium]|nr:Gfo/Idh/MocA family oxidoreductase [Chloroflexota bacterium]
MSTIKWGILSTARHAANTVIPAIHAARNAQAYAVASRDAGRARQFAEETGLSASYGSYEDLLADPQVDAVYIPLPNNLHKEWSIKAAQAGKHVLCEKPLALNAAEAQEMVDAFQAAGRKLAEAFQWRHHAQGERVYQMVRQGEIGELRLIDAGFSFPLDRPDDIRWDPALGGGSLYDVGCYPISLARYITRAEPLSVTAHARWAASGVDDLVVATLEFPGGVLAHINCSFALPLRRYFELVGSEGTLYVNRAYNPTGNSGEEVLRYGPDREVVQQIGLESANSYTLMIEDFSGSVLQDTELLFPPEDAVFNMRVIDAIFEAARTGATVRLG